MNPLPQYRSVVSIIPGGCVQFLDLGFDFSQVGRVRRYFREDRHPENNEQAGKEQAELVCLDFDEITGQHVDRLTGTSGDYDYEVDGQRALEFFCDKWVPLPFFRTREDRWPDGQRRFEKGPSNWARIFFTRLSGAGKEAVYRLVVAFDTNLEEQPEGTEAYFALCPKDVSEKGEFRLAHHERDNSWLLNAGWMDQWLHNAYNDYWASKRRGRQHDDEEGYVHEDRAHYLTFLEVLQRAKIFPKLRLTDPEEYVPIDVDLVLDLGNSRSCAILVETKPQATTKLSDSYLMQLRDLSQPYMVYRRPFETRLEFVETVFGNNRLSARSGRLTPAFVWPSVVRIGPEAVRLGHQSVSAEGSTGSSSPKRYLWDERARLQEWRFNPSAVNSLHGAPVTRGIFVQKINKEGTPLSRTNDPVFRRSPALRKQSKDVAFESRFTRSSLMMFMLSEIILHALVTINSPEQRSLRENSDIPRRLRSIIVTVPTAMPLAEQKIFQRWANWAVDVVWQTMGWSEFYVAAKPGVRLESKDYRLCPEVRCDWDEATCSQLVYLYNELSEKYGGDVHHLFRLLGMRRAGDDAEASLRIASLDVGGGTTDLSITTYEVLGDEGTSSQIRPHLNMREGFNIAGDDVLCAIIEDHILRSVKLALEKAGVVNTRSLLGGLFGREVADKSVTERNLRAQFARQVAMRAGLALLDIYEKSEDVRGGSGPNWVSLGDLLGTNGQPGPGVLAYLEDEVRRVGAREFSLMEVPVVINRQAIEKTILGVLGEILADLSEVIHAYGCDLVLLTGRPSRWPAMGNAMLAKLPVPPDRIIAMKDYWVGNWYPYTDAMGRIADPKTSVVVGAILCALAEGYLEDFSFDTKSLGLGSTARYVGALDADGKLKDAKVWFEVDVDDPQQQEFEREIQFSQPTVIGFRQLGLERWPTNRFYVLDFANPMARSNARGMLPYKVTLLYSIAELDDYTNEERDEGELQILDVEALDGTPRAKSDLEVRLQTLPFDEGYWLDTGIFHLV